ncbi:MAG: response regulator [Puniceicoccales bacterium]|jgi:CheY-like chemotaxis protein|nr:response regulator [Puniceicoccales bacterium]
MKSSSKVLFIDDDKIFLDTQTKFLRLSGFEVVKAESGEDGLVSLSNEMPDIVVCDMIMENFDGFDFLNRFSTTGFFKKIPFLCISGYTVESMASRCMSYGADGYLKKPIDCNVLKCAIFVLIDSYSV